MIASDPQAPKSSEQNPVHQSDLQGLLMDGEKYQPAGGGVFASTVRGTAFHNRQADACREQGSVKSIADYFAGELAKHTKVDWEGRTQAEMVREAEQWSAALDPVFSPRATYGFMPEVSFKFRLPENGCWYEGTIDVLHLELAAGRIKSVSLWDYKTGIEQPDFRMSPQHHLYCLALKHGVLDNVPYIPGHHLLDWTKSTLASAFYVRQWPKQFRYLHLPPLVNRNAAWNLLALGTDSQPMNVADSTAYINVLTQRLLDKQPTRLAVAIPAAPEPQPEKIMQPQAMIPAPAQATNTIVSTRQETIAMPSYEECFNVGATLQKSGFFADAKNETQAVAKVLAGRELGIPPVQALTQIQIVQGKITLGATLIAALIKRSGRYDYRVVTNTDTACKLDFYENGKLVGDSEFTMQDAANAGLAGKSIWKQYPRNMMFARAISNGAKWYCPDVFGGAIYTAEELENEPASQPIVEVKTTPVEPAPTPQPASPQYSWGEPRGEGLATDAQIKRLRANCDTLGFSLAKVIKTATSIGAAADLTSVADLPQALIVRLILKTEELLKKAEAPRPEREKTAADLLEEQVRQIVGHEIRTKRAKELAEIIRSGPLSVEQIVEIMENEAAPDTQFTALPEVQQEQLLHTIKRAADSAASRAMAGAAASNGNGHQ